jgi:hypothetical protein
LRGRLQKRHGKGLHNQRKSAKWNAALFLVFCTWCFVFVQLTPGKVQRSKY